ncbi:MAG: hypothetical protein U5R49_18585 [Deltaproteobacteria bacterium]|nr:hypothetical protein [Deltaproteobacteria bacterium]
MSGLKSGFEHKLMAPPLNGMCFWFNLMAPIPAPARRWQRFMILSPLHDDVVHGFRGSEVQGSGFKGSRVERFRQDLQDLQDYFLNYELNVINLTDRLVSREEFPNRSSMVSRIFSSRPYWFNGSLKDILKVGYQLHNL